jgi:hypothetical protein
MLTKSNRFPIVLNEGGRKLQYCSAAAYRHRNSHIPMDKLQVTR